MKEFNIQPSSWAMLSKTDKKILHYHRVIEGHYMEQVNEKHEREMKMAQQKQDFLSKLPQQTPRRGR